MYVVGLTGSIGSGKSTVSKMIGKEGFTILDADEIARNITSSDPMVLEELVHTFGNTILNEEGDLDRRKLAEIAFGNHDNQKKLSEIVTMRVKKIMDRRIKELKDNEVIFLDVPLLFEYDIHENADEVWSVVADYDIRYNRANLRDGITEEDFKARDSAQISQLEKIVMSDVVIWNNGDLESLEERVDIEINKLKNRIKSR